MSQIEFSDKSLKIDSEYTVDFSYPIENAFYINGVIVVFFNPDSFPMQGLNCNLIGLNERGAKIWKAELPKHSKFDIWVYKGKPPKSSDIFMKVKCQDSIIAYSFSSYECKINEQTGKIESAEFYK